MPFILSDSAGLTLLSGVGPRGPRYDGGAGRLRHVTIEVCAPAPSNGARAETGRDLDLPEWLALGYQIRRDFGTSVSILIAGGEPLARPDLPLLLRLLTVLGFHPAVEISGLGLDAARTRLVAPFLSAATVRLDGLAPAHEAVHGPGTFAPAVKAVRRLVRAKVRRVGVRTEVTPEGRADLPELERLVLRLGAHEWRLVGSCTGSRRASRDSGRTASGPGGTGRWGSSLAVLADGSVVPCVRARGPVAGNVRDESLLAVWRRAFPARPGAWEPARRDAPTVR